jgi:hypothetical protein
MGFKKNEMIRIKASYPNDLAGQVGRVIGREDGQYKVKVGQKIEFFPTYALSRNLTFPMPPHHRRR